MTGSCLPFQANIHLWIFNLKMNSCRNGKNSDSFLITETWANVKKRIN
jgi:hypothetical protein